MNTAINITSFKKIIILFWTLWWLIILWTDSVSVAAHLGWLHATWAPDKYAPFVSTLDIYHVSPVLPALLYMGILGWVLIIIMMFIWASMSINKDKKIWLARANIAFITSIVLWFAFIIADQIIMRYDIEQIHMMQGGFQFLSFLALYLLPDN